MHKLSPIVFTLRAESPSIFLEKSLPDFSRKIEETLLAGYLFLKQHRKLDERFTAEKVRSKVLEAYEYNGESTRTTRNVELGHRDTPGAECSCYRKML